MSTVSSGWGEAPLNLCASRTVPRYRMEALAPQ